MRLFRDCLPVESIVPQLDCSGLFPVRVTMRGTALSHSLALFPGRASEMVLWLMQKTATRQQTCILGQQQKSNIHYKRKHSPLVDVHVKVA